MKDEKFWHEIDHGTYVARVPGGLLYRYWSSGHGATALAFVPCEYAEEFIKTVETRR